MAKEDVADTGAYPVASGETGSSNGAARVLRRRRGLPSGRAVVGGFLVALAAVGVFGAWSASTAGPRHSYLVAADDIPVGHRITGDDIARRPLDLPEGFHAFRDPADVLGATALGPLARGELLQRGMIVRRPAGDDGAQLSFAVERSRALNGKVAPGDHIDLLATYGDTDPYTVAVLRHVLVADTDDKVGALSQKTEIVLTITLPDPADVLAVTHAIRAGELTIVRSAGPPGADDPTVYAPGADGADRQETRP